LATAAKNLPPITVRDARQADIPALTAIKGQGSETLHRDRLRDAQGSGFRYLVLLAEENIVGFACLVLRRPANWSDAGDTQHLPQIVDLQVREAQRGRGYGSAFMRAIEHLAAAAGYRELYLSVTPLTNPRAYALYQRLGYQPIKSEPHRKNWEFIDSDGKVHRGEDWVVDMVKSF
jgi:ribosomal protein S18 acetylase RimI-like enzyme